MGAGSISFIATNNATLQLRADPAMRGRVMSLNAIAFLGSTPIGAPLLGYISDVSKPADRPLVGGIATLGASVPLFFLATRQRDAQPPPAAIAVVADEDSNVVPLPLARLPGATARRRTSVRRCSEPRSGSSTRIGAGPVPSAMIAERYDRVRPPYPAR